MNHPIFPIFSVIQDFEAISFSEPERIKANHRSLYYFLINLCVRKSGLTKFNLAYDFALHGSRIGSWRTYTKCMEDLQDLGLIKYTKGANRFSSPIVELLFSNPTSIQVESYRQIYFTSLVNSIDKPIAHNTDDHKIISSDDYKIKKEDQDDKSSSSTSFDLPDDLNVEFIELEKQIQSGPNVRMLENQLTKKEFFHLRETFTFEDLQSVLEAMENKKGIRKHSSVNLTMRKWLNMDYGSGIKASEYKPFETMYREFHQREVGSQARIDRFQKSQLKAIIKYLKENSIDKTYSKALESFAYILKPEKWKLLSEFHQRQVKPSEINKNLESILTQHRNGKNATNQQNGSNVKSDSGGRRRMEV